ncbi:hypothetical protein [Stenotrophomonas sp. 24(2023)]|uniref:hypothetical protein n=1 Tax=Stenotrophomonas sp. 24(2023) TaxID=3068324 RepID=UPI0027E1663B|nr:hypothetical protein [Stenotrophomonas sp. 24(2023)]WMJ68162.1 hypothetical protein Q9R17_13250 [Stenotrophomonas sp. 24(2023)]
MNTEDAIRIEGLGDVGAAIDAYDDVIRLSRSSAAVANSMVLCWQSLDFGNVASNNLHPDFVGKLEARLSELIRMSGDGCFRWGEVDFWGRYIRWADYGEDFGLTECMNFIRKSDGYIEPAFHVLSITGGREMVEQSRVLLREYSGVATARARYVTSVIASVLR